MASPRMTDERMAVLGSRKSIGGPQMDEVWAELRRARDSEADLLVALRYLLTEHRQRWGTDSCAFCRLAEEAIAKAEGRE